MNSDEGRAGVRIRTGEAGDTATLTRFNVAMAMETEEKALDPDVCGLRLYVERENAAALHSYAKVGMGETPYRLFEVEFDSGGERP